jgi:hypothetical protein
MIFVDVFDRFSIQSQMPGDIGDGHHPAQL